MKLHAILAGLIAFSASVSATELITNSSFDSGSQSWLPLTYTGNIAGPSTPMPASPALPAPDYSTAGMVRIFGRRWHTEGIYQNILPALPSPPNPAGEPYRFKVRIKAEADVCFVRCILTFVNTTPNPDVFGTPFIVAEKVLRTTTPGQWQWVEVEGVKNITWPTTFTANEARISVDVGQVYKEKFPGQPPTWLSYPSGKWPAFTLDYVSMDRDTDLDGLSDAEEAALNPPTLPNNLDTDGDGLPDKWEKDHLLSPTVADSSADTDQDGFTNAEEYWAATDPQLTTSYPGKTANPAATAATKAVAKMLALAPSKGKHLIGQTVDNASTEYQAGVVALANRVLADTGTARWPAMISLTIEGVGTPLKIASIMPYAKSYTDSGHLVVLKWAMWNPWTGGNVNSQGAVGQVDILGLVDATSPNYNVQANVTARGVLRGWLDAVALELSRFIDPAFGGHPDNVIIFRPMSEMTGDWDWFGHRSAEEYNALWHYLYTDFTARGLNHLLWCYESAQSEHHYLIENATTLVPAGTDGITTGSTNARPVPADYYYPGDGEVDIMGHNFYDNDWVLPNDLNAVFRNYPKIYAFPQAGASTAKIGPNLLDNLNYVTRIATAFPRASFFIPWSTYTTNGGAVTIHHAIIDNPHPTELMTDPSMITDSWMSPWQQWARVNLGTLTAAMTADTDADGLSDALEYALGTAPLTATPQAFTVSQSSATSPLALTFTRNLSAADAIYTIEASADLATWQAVARAVGTSAWSILACGTLSQTPNGTVTFTDNVTPSASTRRFLRLSAFVP